MENDKRQLTLYFSGSYVDTIGSHVISLSVAQLVQQDGETVVRNLSYWEALNDFQVKWDYYKSYYDKNEYTERTTALFSCYILDDAKKATEIAKILRQIETGLKKIAEKEGSTRDFGIYAARICRILKIDTITFRGRKHEGIDLTGYDAFDHVHVVPGLGADALNREAQKVREQHGPIRTAVAA